MSLCITRLSTQDPHNQIKHTEFYEECYGKVKDIEKNLSQKNYNYGDRKLQIMKFETKRSNSIKDKNQLLFFPTLVIKFLLPS